MVRHLLWLLWLTLLPPQLAAEELSVLVEARMPAVVRVEVLIATHPGGPSGSTTPLDSRSTRLRAGSGVFIRQPDAAVLTSSQLFSRPVAAIRVLTTAGDSLEARLAVLDESAGFALLALEGGDATVPATMALQPGLSTPGVGTLVLVLGNPLVISQGDAPSVTFGVIAAVRRLRSSQGGPTGAVLQTDAGLDPGDVGGPVIDLRGRLIGIVHGLQTSPLTHSEIGVIIPISTITAALGLAPSEQPGTLGVLLDPAAGGADGAYVFGVVGGSPAARAGIRIGDCILAWDGQPVADTQALIGLLEHARAGDRVLLTLSREGVQLELTVQLEAP